MDLWSPPTRYPTIWILLVYQQTCLISSNNPSVTKLHYKINFISSHRASSVTVKSTKKKTRIINDKIENKRIEVVCFHFIKWCYQCYVTFCSTLLSCLFTGPYSYSYVVISDSLQCFLMQDIELLYFIYKFRLINWPCSMGVKSFGEHDLTKYC